MFRGGAGYTAWIRGRFCASEGRGVGVQQHRIEVRDPATRQRLFDVLEADHDTVQAAIASARAAFDAGLWSRAEPQTRAKVLADIAKALDDEVPRLARLEVLQTGRPVREMTTQLGRLPEWLEYFAAVARTHEGRVTPFKGEMLNYVRRVPLGVVAQITPWNHPLLIAIKKIAPALAAGNSIVVKPSELAPACVFEFAEICQKAGLPDGVLNVVCGRGSVTGKSLSESRDIAKVDLTGGNATGAAVGASAGRNMVPMIAELGGKAPLLIFDDTDMDAAVNGAAFAAFIAAGQTCVMGSRILVQSSIHDDFVKKLVAKTRSIRLGSPLDMATQMGPVISSAQLDRVESLVKTAIPEGGSFATGGKRPDAPEFANGFYFEPTIITGLSPDSTLAQEEVFGPVVVVLKVDGGEEDMIRVANNSRYGLAASVWTRDVKRAHRVADKIDAGIIWINGHHHNDPSSPWGGMKDSGVGRENGLEAYEEYTQSKSVVVNYGPATDWFSNSGGPSRYG